MDRCLRCGNSLVSLLSARESDHVDAEVEGNICSACLVEIESHKDQNKCPDCSFCSQPADCIKARR